MNDSAELLVRKLDAAARAGQPVDIHQLLGAMTMAVVGTTAFGCYLCGAAEHSARWLHVKQTAKI